MAPSTLIQQSTTLSSYLPTPAHLMTVKPLTAQEKLFTIQLPAGISLQHSPGQFVQVSLFGIGEAPISISSSPSRSNGSFELCIRRAGSVTEAMHRLQPGEMVGIRGPFGSGFPIEQFRGSDLLFAPGGLGLAPLRSLINQVLDEREKFGRVIILYGARNPSELLFKDELDLWAATEGVELHLTVDRADESWKGNVGVITTLFPKIKIHAANTVAITVGPPVMYRFVLAELFGMGVKEENVWISLERRMKCGVGKCGHCQINQFFTCMDGPGFSFAQIKHAAEAI